MAGPVLSVLVFPGLAAYATETHFSPSWWRGEAALEQIEEAIGTAQALQERVRTFKLFEAEESERGAITRGNEGHRHRSSGPREPPRWRPSLGTDGGRNARKGRGLTSIGVLEQYIALLAR
ncbi:MAG: hypothetical protein BRD35_06280 [Bacteroidetes bacterium QH_7_62_13]|nr:MAG: hypothetical protein BRD35_06280 [Bacteroidetes bacterium QH_7_62_13]